MFRRETLPIRDRLRHLQAARDELDPQTERERQEPIGGRPYSLTPTGSVNGNPLSPHRIVNGTPREGVNGIPDNAPLLANPAGGEPTVSLARLDDPVDDDDRWGSLPESRDTWQLLERRRFGPLSDLWASPQASTNS